MEFAWTVAKTSRVLWGLSVRKHLRRRHLLATFCSEGIWAPITIVSPRLVYLALELILKPFPPALPNRSTQLGFGGLTLLVMDVCSRQYHRTLRSRYVQPSWLHAHTHPHQTSIDPRIPRLRRHPRPRTELHGLPREARSPLGPPDLGFCP